MEVAIQAECHFHGIKLLSSKNSPSAKSFILKWFVSQIGVELFGKPMYVLNWLIKFNFNLIVELMQVMMV